MLRTALVASLPGSSRRPFAVVGDRGGVNACHFLRQNHGAISSCLTVWRCAAISNMSIIMFNVSRATYFVHRAHAYPTARLITTRCVAIPTQRAVSNARIFTTYDNQRKDEYADVQGAVVRASSSGIATPTP